MREPERIYCSCGGRVVVKDTTPSEDARYHNCPYRCCLRAYECSVCNARWVFVLEAPEDEREKEHRE